MFPPVSNALALINDRIGIVEGELVSCGRAYRLGRGDIVLRNPMQRWVLLVRDFVKSWDFGPKDQVQGHKVGSMRVRIWESAVPNSSDDEGSSYFDPNIGYP